jgi:hypothetical protein
MTNLDEKLETVQEILILRRKYFEQVEENKDNIEKFIISLKNKYDDFKTENKNIFNLTVQGHMDINKFKFMINMKKKVLSNQISEHDASVKVGEKLVNEFVKPHIDKSK